MSIHEMKIPLSRPDISLKEKRAVLDVLETPYLSLGPIVEEFEGQIAKYVGVQHAVAVNSGTSALHLSIRALGIEPGDEVITTPFSFISSANSILMEGAHPVFVDIDPHTYLMDVISIEQAITRKTKAILGVNVFGVCMAWDRIEALAKSYNLKVIEDSCEAIGSEYKGKKAGSFGDVGCFGFYPNKQMTTGEGGMILTDSLALASTCRSLRNQGRGEGDDAGVHVRLGFNCRLSDINCALGLAQLSRLDEILNKREQVAAWYDERLSHCSDIILPILHQVEGRSWFVYVIQCADRFSRAQRDAIMRGLKHAGVGCAPYFVSIHLQPFYRARFGYKTGDFPVTESVSDRTIALPFYNGLTVAQVDEVVEALLRELKRNQ